MKIPEKPANEQQRLAALRAYKILDTPPEEAFEDITRLAAEVCGMPIALVTFVEECRQWFKSKVGIDAAETSRDVSFCAHALSEPKELLVVDDASKDPRFADNPLVIGDPGIRFYAGAPLVTPGGHALGTLCVIDRVPRHLTEAQLDVLRVLGHQVMTQLELRRAFEDLASLWTVQNAILKSTSYTIIATNRDGVITSFNRAAEVMLGYAAEEVIGQKMLDFCHDRDDVARRTLQLSWELNRPISRFDAVTAKAVPGKVDEQEWNYVRRDGTRFPVRLSVSALSESGRITGYLAIGADITEQKRIEKERQAISKLGQRMSTASTPLDAGRIILEIAEELFPVDAYFLDAYAADRNELDKILYLDTINGKLVPIAGVAADRKPTAMGQKVIREGAQLLLRDEKATEAVPLIIVGDTSRRAKSLMFVPIRFRNRIVALLSVQSYQANAYDKNDLDLLQILVDRAGGALQRIRVEQELRATEERYRDLFDHSSDLIQAIDLHGRFLFVNPAWHKAMGYSRAELNERTFWELVATEKREQCQEAFRSLVGGRGFERVETELITKDGRRLTVIGSATCHFDTEGTSFRCTFHDITERKKFEAELAGARDAALDSARLKSEFLANMSHEIRTPMNGVLGMTTLLLDTRLTEQQRDFAETIRFSAENLLTIINDILDFSKIEAGKLVFETLDFDLLRTVEETVGLFADLARRKNVELADWVEANVPLRLRGDAGRLRQVLTNLLGNAIKFTERGEVTLKVSQVSDNEQQCVVRFEVRDTGIGISSPIQARLFQPFQQADGSTTRKYGGTGLGLAISKYLVERMEGDIGVTSEEGVGSTFWFTAVFAKQTETNAVPTLELDLSESSALIVDDNATNREIIRHYLKSWGVRSEGATDAAEALLKLRMAAEAGAPFDLAILDWQMPGIDGVMLAQEIKKDVRLSGTRSILLSSLGDQLDAGALHTRGIEICLLKPIRKSRLFDAIAAVASKTKTRPRTELVVDAALESQTLGQLRILLAEDNPVNAKVALGLLKRIGCSADVVTNGVEALTAVGSTRYDVILMDCQMPEMDGYEATGKIRRLQAKDEQKTIIVAMTANAMQGDREKCLAAGMDDYISKPINLDQLKGVLQKWESHLRGGGEPGNGPLQVVEESPNNVIDLDRLKSLADDSAGVRELAVFYLDQTRLQLAKLQAAVTANDAKNVAAIAHTVIGSSATCGMKRIVVALRRLEQQAKASSLSDASALLASVFDEFRAIETAVPKIL